MSAKSKSASKPPPLGKFLSTALQSKGQRLRAIAEQIGMTYAALKQDLSKSRFYPDDLKILCQNAGLPSDESTLRSRFCFEIKERPRGPRHAGREMETRIKAGTATLTEVFQELDERTEGLRAYIQSARSIIPKFFKTMSKGSVLVVFIADDLPTHWNGRTALEWVPTILESLLRGTRIVYLHPSEEIVPSIRDSALSSVLSPDEVNEEFRRFKQRLEFAIEQTPAYEKVNLDTSLLVIPHNCPAICMPSHRYVLYLFADESGSGHFATGTFPVRGTGALGEDDPSANYPVFPLNRHMTSLLEKVFERSIQDFRPKAPQAQKEHIAKLLSVFNAFCQPSMI